MTDSKIEPKSVIQRVVAPPIIKKQNDYRRYKMHQENELTKHD